jgi:hypothetical protein
VNSTSVINKVMSQLFLNRFKMDFFCLDRNCILGLVILLVFAAAVPVTIILAWNY